MSQSLPIILFVDDDEDLAKTQAELLGNEGYRVLCATNVSQARRHFDAAESQIDLAIIDIRLTNGGDPTDISGLEFARQLPPTLPKIILTAHGSVELAGQVLAILDGPPIAVGFVSKADSNLGEKLICTVRKALTTGVSGLKEWAAMMQGVDEQLEKDYAHEQKHLTFCRHTTLIAAILAGAVFAAGIILTYLQYVELAIVSAVGTGLSVFIGSVFLKQVHTSDQLVARYHVERVQRRWFSMLLQACSSIEPTARRNQCREQLISMVAGRVFAVHQDVQPVLTEEAA